MLQFSSSGDSGLFVGEHYGYRRLSGKVVHRRTIRRESDTYRVEDEITGGGEHEITLRWRLCPGEWTAMGDGWSCEIAGREIVVRCSVPDGFSCEMVSGVQQPSPEGWESLYYGENRLCPRYV